MLRPWSASCEIRRRSLPDLARDAHMVAAQDVAQVFLAIAPLEQSIGDFGYALRGHHADAVWIFIGRIDFGMRLDEFLDFRVVEGVVEPDSDMLGAHQVGHVIDVPHHRVDADVVVAQERADAVDSNDAAGLCAGADELVIDIARMIPYGARIGMGEDDGVAGAFQDFLGASGADVRAAYDHSDPLHLIHDRSTKIRESGILVLAAAGEGIITVIGEEQPAHAELVVERYEARLLVETIATLDVEADRQSSFLWRLLDVAGPLHQKIVLRVRLDPMPEIRDESDGVLIRSGIKSHVERHRVDARSLVSLELSNRACFAGTDCRAGVVVPDQNVREESPNIGRNCALFKGDCTHTQVTCLHVQTS